MEQFEVTYATYWVVIITDSTTLICMNRNGVLFGYFFRLSLKQSVRLQNGDEYKVSFCNMNKITVSKLINVLM